MDIESISAKIDYESYITQMTSNYTNLNKKEAIREHFDPKYVCDQQGY